MSANNGWSRELEVRFWAWVQTLAMDHDATLDKAIRMSRRLQNTATAWMMWACWVSSKRTRGVVTKRGHRQMHSKVRSGTLIVTHENSTRHHRTWHFSSIIHDRNSSMEKKWGLSAFLHPCSHTWLSHSPLPGSQLPPGDLIAGRGY